MKATSRRIPSALQIVAFLFLVHGIFSAIGIAVRLSSGFINIDLGVLGIPTFFGLRRLSVGWRTFALVYIWIALISCPVLFLVGILADAPTSVRMFGKKLAQVSPIWLSIVSIPVFILVLWQYRVLTRPQIRALFFGDSREPNVA
ncbi:hypothetical protein ACXR0O_25560 [Verrucomicrobiota bacterium sgz303538]